MPRSQPEPSPFRHPSIEQEEAEARAQEEALTRRRGWSQWSTTVLGPVSTSATAEPAVDFTPADGPSGPPPALSVALEATSTVAAAAASQPTDPASGLLPPSPYEVKSAEVRTRLKEELEAVAHKWETLEMVVGLALLKKKIKAKEVRAPRGRKGLAHPITCTITWVCICLVPDMH